MNVSKKANERNLGKMMILNALKLEESLADLLRSEARLLRRQISKNYDKEDMLKITKVVKYIIFSITILDDRIKTGMELIEKDTDKEDNNK